MIHGFTPIQTRMLKVLSDGELHTREELHECLDDELGPLRNVAAHLTALRKRIRPTGCDILCQYLNRKFFYRLVILHQGKRAVYKVPA